jgi:DNA-binding TFAR19-related protein (PDSD5 family)
VEEFIQDAATAQPIADAIVRSLNEEAHKTRLKTFHLIREQLARPLELHAVPAIAALIEDGSA